jgi:RNA polymerase sigma factor (sigma-70 family)
MAAPGVQERFQALIDEHKKIVYKICNSYCRNYNDREDLAQEIVVQLWNSFSSFDERRRFSTWMYRIALNVAISFYRRENTRSEHFIALREHLLDTADETANQSPDVQPLYQLIERLGPFDKALILLYLDENSYGEIADVLGITETNVATKINRLKIKMRQDLGEIRRS